VISMPLAFADIQLIEYLSRPVTWIFFLLITSFCFTESKASLYLSHSIHTLTEKPFLPYMTGVCILIVFWVAIFDSANYFQAHPAQLVIGGLLIILGIFVRLLSIEKLNTYFVSHVAHIDNHQLITTGIYSIVRHPSELGLLSICAGVVIFLSSITGFFVIVIALLPLTIYRVTLEDKLLQSLFTTNYEKYRANTPSLFPKIISSSANKALQRAGR